MAQINPPKPNPLIEWMEKLLREKAPGVAEAAGKVAEYPPVKLAGNLMNAGDPMGIMGMGMVTAPKAMANALRGYHGTDAATDFAKFGKTNDFGYHFAADPKAAETRLLTQGAGQVGNEFAPGARIIPADLNIKNPVRLPDLGTWSKPKTLQALVDAGVITKSQMATELTMGKVADPRLAKEMWQESVQDMLKAKGYDGIVYKNAIEGAGDSYIALHPDQIAMGIRKGD